MAYLTFCTSLIAFATVLRVNQQCKPLVHDTIAVVVHAVALLVGTREHRRVAIVTVEILSSTIAALAGQAENTRDERQRRGVELATRCLSLPP